MRLGDILIERGVITEAQLSQGLEYQWTTGARLGEALVQLGYVTTDQIAAALAWQGTLRAVGHGRTHAEPERRGASH